MKKILLFLFLNCALFFSAQATHIVGGELGFEHQRNNQYHLSLTLYFDAINGNAGALDDNVTLHIFRKSDDAYMESVTLPLTRNDFVNYTNPDCAVGSLATRRIYYELTQEMDPAIYDDSQGYYMIWERCCRNGIISNITAPGDAGQTFYLEFPRLSIKNSSPTLFPPLSDYACVNQDFSFDFGGTDPDGDALKYSLATPINGFSNRNDPNPNSPNPAPYPLVNFVGGIGVNNMIPGSPSLSIDSKGILSVKASQAGLYVFAIACEEFRNGQKIGEVRREFQLQVLDCPAIDPPKLEMTVGVGQTLYKEGQILIYNDDDDRCETLHIKDINPSTTATITIVPLNFAEGIYASPAQGFINGAGDELTLDLCFPDCPNPSGQPYIANIIVADNSCSLPLYDTLQVKAIVNVKPNNKPEVKSSLTFNADLGCFEAEAFVGETLEFDMFGDDIDIDTVELVGIGQGFSMEGLGISFEKKKGIARLTSPFSWTPACDLLGANQDSMVYFFTFEVKDFNKCFPSEINETCVKIVVKKKPDNNNIPQITTSLSYDSADLVYFDTLTVNELENFNINVLDVDGDSLTLELLGIGFNLKDLSMNFSPDNGIRQINAQFNWQTLCEYFQSPTDTNVFLINVFANDYDFCGNIKDRDTTKIRLVVLPEFNLKPTLTTDDLVFDSLQNLYCDTLTLGESLVFTLLGDDPDKDTISIKAYPEGFTFADLGIQFDEVRGFPTQSAKFEWNTGCDLYNTINYDSAFYMNFIVADENNCDANQTDTVRVKFVILNPNADNINPIATSSLFYDSLLGMYVDSVEVLDTVRFDVFVNDENQDSLFLAGFGIDFDMDSVGMQFSNTSGRASLQSPFFWAVGCNAIDNLTDSKDYFVKFVANDYLNCDDKTFDSILVKIVVLPPLDNNTQPKVSTELVFDTNLQVYCDTVGLDETINFDILGEDLENDNISITAFGIGFNLDSLGMNFSSADGLSPQTANFDWTTNCSMLSDAKDDTVYYVNFVIDEIRQDCLIPLRDSITVKILLLRKDNIPPLVSTNLEYDAINDIYNGTVNVNDEITFDAIGEDPDNEPISIDAKGLGVDLIALGFEFSPITGDSPQSMPISWTPTCGFLGQNQEKTIELEIRVSDIPFCNDSSFETVKVRITVKDRVSAGDFLPVNVFTPNADGKNDSFAIPDLPVDGCRDSFKSITIFNRWGKEVFQSQDRNFEWAGGKFPSGVYFYVINYISGDFSGSVSLIRSK